jgi:hypothetical protein
VEDGKKLILIDCGLEINRMINFSDIIRFGEMII